MNYSKIKKFIREPDIYNNVCHILLKNYRKIFEIYLYCNGHSNYPSIEWLEFTGFCEDVNIYFYFI